MPDYYRVKEAFAYGHFVATPGEIWAGDNPAFKGREQFFEPVASAAVVRATETATAGPGELRSVAKKAPAKKAPEPVAVPEKKSEPKDII